MRLYDATALDFAFRINDDIYDPEEFALLCLAEDDHPTPREQISDITYEEAMEMLEQSANPFDHARRADFVAALQWIAKDYDEYDYDERTPQKRMAQALAICRVAAKYRCYKLLPPPELTTECL